MERRRHSPLSACALLLAIAGTAPAQIAYQGSGTAVKVANGNMTTVPVPAGIANGDILLVVVHTRDNVSSTMPAGWILATQGSGNTTNRLTVFWKRTTGVEAAPTVSRSGGNAGIARMHAFRGARSSGSPFNAIGAVRSNAGSPISTSAVSTTLDGCLILHVFGSQDDNTWGSYGGIPTNAGGVDFNTLGSDNSLGLTYGTQPTAGSTGNASATQTARGPDAGVSVQLAMELPSAPSPGLWLGAVSTTWTDGLNWDDGSPPGPAADVRVPPGCAFNPAITSDVGTINGLTVRTNATLTISGGGTVQTSSTTTIEGSLTIPGGTLNHFYDASGSFRVFGTVTASSGALRVGDAPTQSLSDLVINSGAKCSFTGATVDVCDELQVLSGGTLEITAGTLTVCAHSGSGQGTAAVKFRVDSGATLDNDTGGTIVVNGAYSYTMTYPAAQISSGATVTLNSAGDTDITFQSNQATRESFYFDFQGHRAADDLRINHAGFAVTPMSAYVCEQLTVQAGSSSTNGQDVTTNEYTQIDAGAFYTVDGGTHLVDDNSNNYFRVYGSATVSSGTLDVGVAATQDDTDLTVYGGGSLTINGGTVNVCDELEVQNGGTLTLSSGTVNVCAYTGGITGSADAKFDIEGTATFNANGGQVNVLGASAFNPSRPAIRFGPSATVTGGATSFACLNGQSTNESFYIDLRGNAIGGLTIQKPGLVVEAQSGMTCTGALIVEDGTFVTGAQTHVVQGPIDIGLDDDASAARLQIESGGLVRHDVTTAQSVRVGGGATTAGTLQLDGGGTLELDDDSTLLVANGAVRGTLTTSGTSAATRARIEINPSGGAYTVTLAGNGSLDWTTWGNLDAGGVQVQSTAVLSGWSGITFTGGAGGGVYLDISAASAGALPATMPFCQFDSGPSSNVKSGGAGTTHGNVLFSNWAGALGGEAFEANDQLDLVDWYSGDGVVNATTGQAYATLTDAIVSATNGDTIEVRDGLIRDEPLDLSASGLNKWVTIDGAILRPSSGVAVIGRGSSTEEVLKNCLLIGNGASPALRNVGRVFHCTIVGTGTLVQRTSGSMTLRGCIIGDPNPWNGGTPVSGSVTITYSDVDGGFAGTGNFNSDPLFVMYHPASGLYDVHLKPSSPCVDYAPAPPVTIDTDFDRGTDLASADLGTDNPRRPIDARPDAAYATWTSDFGTYDVGADELGAFTAAGRCQGTPVWVNRAGAEPASGVSDPDSHSSPLPFSSYGVLFVAENLDVSQATPNIRVMAFSMNDGDADEDLDAIEAFALPASVQKVHSLTAETSASQANLFCVVDTTDADTVPDAIVSLRYAPALTPRFALRWGPTAPAGSGTISRMAFQQSSPRHLLFVRGGWLNRMQTADGGAPGASGNWLANGQLDPAGTTYDGRLDTEGSLFSSALNNIVYVPVNAPTNPVTDSEILAITLNDGGISAEKDCGTSNRNHTGGTSMAASLFVTASDRYVWRLHQDTLDWDGDDGGGSPRPWTWRGDLGAGNRTTGWATVFRSSDRHVRVPAWDRIFRFRRESANSVGVLSADSDGAGDDWGPGRTFRGVISTPLLISGSLSKLVGGTRYGAKVAFGTEEGHCYVASYIRDTATFDMSTAEPNDDSQPAASGIASEVKDGTPYPGFPYRIPGVRIASITLVRSSVLGRDVYVFVTDTGWMYGFVEPY